MNYSYLDNLGLANWCIVGCRSVDDVGVIIDHQNRDDELYDDIYYSFKTEPKNSKIPLRIIRFIGFNGRLVFQSLDLYGMAVPSSKEMFSEKEIKQKYSLPSEVLDWFGGD